MRYLILIDSQPNPASSFFADLSDAKRSAEKLAADHPHDEISIEGYPEGAGGPISTWRYDRNLESWVLTR